MDNLKTHLSAFLASSDHSAEAARKIEAELNDIEENELLTDLRHMLASYQPGGGPYLFNEDQLVAEIRYVLDRLPK